jgi:hypothetical protein
LYKGGRYKTDKRKRNGTKETHIHHSLLLVNEQGDKERGT